MDMTSPEAPPRHDEEKPPEVAGASGRPRRVRLSTRTVKWPVIVLAFAIVPSVLDPTTLGVLNSIGIASLGAMALNMLTGFAGQVSIGNAALMLVGAFTAGLLGAQSGLPFPLVLLSGLLVGALTGLLIGAPAVRLRGLYLVITTLSFHYIALYVGLQVQDATVGSVGYLMPLAELGPFVIDTDIKWTYLIWIVSALSCLAIANLMRGRYGRAWRMIRDGEIAAESVGIHVTGYKLLAFVLSSALISLQGVIFAYYYGSVQVEGFTLDVALQYVAMIIVGGMGALAGSYLGAVFVVAVPYFVQLWLSEPIESAFGPGSMRDIQSIFYGACIVGFLLLEPKGIHEILTKAWDRILGHSGGVLRTLRKP